MRLDQLGNNKRKGLWAWARWTFLLAALLIGFFSFGREMVQAETWPTPLPFLSWGGPVKVNLLLEGCNTSVDIVRRMGEVTNVYVTAENVGQVDLDQVWVTASASDEERTHPDKTRFVPYLPAEHQVTLKLTVDTAWRKKTAINVFMTTSDGIMIVQTGRSDCKEIDPNLADNLSRIVGYIVRTK